MESRRGVYLRAVFSKQSLTRLVAHPVAHENWRKRQSKCSGSESVSVSGSAFQDFNPDTDTDPDGFWFGLFSKQSLTRLVAHEKTIVQSRDRQGADPLADARGSVRISILETENQMS
jgi:hypothetical protein